MIISTKQWSTSPLCCNIVFQGDPFSVIVFNTVINTLALQLKQVQPTLGYRLHKSAYTMDALLFADDVTLLAKSSKDQQKLCNVVSDWCRLSKLVIKIPKCSCLGLAYKSKDHLHDPTISICDQKVPFLGHKSFKFLGMPINGQLSTTDYNIFLKNKLQELMTKVDFCPVSSSRKLQLYHQAVYPRLTWYLCLLPLAPSWMKTDLDNIVTFYLKKWCKLHRSACSACSA